jgi:hypothetical protein
LLRVSQNCSSDCTRGAIRLDHCNRIPGLGSSPSSPWPKSDKSGFAQLKVVEWSDRSSAFKLTRENREATVFQTTRRPKDAKLDSPSYRHLESHRYITVPHSKFSLCARWGARRTGDLTQ